MHIPVLLNEVLETLDLKPKKFIIDATLGGGGHAREIIKRIKPGGMFLGIDLSGEAIANFRKETIGEKGVKIIIKQANYADLPEIIEKLKLPLADGLLLDLGFSSIELEAGRGFSFLKDEPLLMTYNEGAEPLWQKLKKLTQNEIYQIIRLTGERYASRISQAIYRYERKGLIQTTSQLVEIICSVVPRHYERKRIHPATRTFLAFRIYVNQELENLKTILGVSNQILKSNGRLVIITFQSLEDRIVKERLNEFSSLGLVRLINKKPLRPTSEEINSNRRARSAKLRAAIKL